MGSDETSSFFPPGPAHCPPLPRSPRSNAPTLTSAVRRVTVCLMKMISIRELHARTGRWVRQAARHGQILVTDHGRTVAKIVPETEPDQTPYFARRKFSPAFQKLLASGKLSRGTDSTLIISQDRDEGA